MPRCLTQSPGGVFLVRQEFSRRRVIGVGNLDVEKAIESLGMIGVDFDQAREGLFGRRGGRGSFCASASPSSALVSRGKFLTKSREAWRNLGVSLPSKSQAQRFHQPQ